MYFKTLNTDGSIRYVIKNNYIIAKINSNNDPYAYSIGSFVEIKNLPARFEMKKEEVVLLKLQGFLDTTY